MNMYLSFINNQKGYFLFLCIFKGFIRSIHPSSFIGKFFIQQLNFYYILNFLYAMSPHIYLFNIYIYAFVWFYFYLFLKQDLTVSP